MRVIAGKARGKKLLSPQTDKIRPTLDRVKESLFNIIGFEIRDCSFLDLFCGIGPFSLRIAKELKAECLANDLNPECFIYLKKNIEVNNL